MQILVAGLGLFKTILILDKLLQEKEEVKYFNNLYKEYVNEMYSIGRTANKYVKLLDKSLAEFLNKNGAESLSKVVQEFLQAKNNLLDKAE
jgi:predicted CopG family antitoxin